MDHKIAIPIYDFTLSLLLDIRFQILFGFLVLAQWAWRLPRPKKGAGNKAVVITGCDSGMGHRMARRFDEMGMHVFAGCLNAAGSGAQSLKEKCSNRLHIVQMDISKDDQVKEAVAYVKANLPSNEKGLYCLVNNAGILAYAGMEWMTTDMCQEVINVNLMGTIRVTKHFLPLILQAQGRIVTIASILARLTYPQTAVYTATKHALNGFFSTLRFELHGTGVHVAVVEPGDFSRTTDIMQWSRNHINYMWENVSPAEKSEKKQRFEELKKQLEVTKCPPSEQEANYKILLEDIEDAMLAEEPRFRYVSAPLLARFKLWFARAIPEDIRFNLILRSQQKSRGI